MSETDAYGGEEMDYFEGGIFEDSGIEAQDAPDNPYGVDRKQFYPIQVLGFKKPKPTAKADKIGMSLIFKALPGSPEALVRMESIGYGNWYQLPVPKRLQEMGMPWDPNSEDGQKVRWFWSNLYKALGFPADQWGKIRPEDLVGKKCLAKISPSLDAETGFWKFNFPMFKEMQNDFQITGNGNDEFAKGTSHNGGKTADELAKEELERELNGGSSG